MVINRYTKLKYKFENRYFRIEKYYVSIEEGKIQYICNDVALFTRSF